MFSIRTSFSGLRKIELVDCPSAKELIKHGPSCDARKWEIVCCVIVTLVMIWQWAAHGHNPAPGHTLNSPEMMQYYGIMWHGQATVKIIREMVTLAMLLRWGQRSVCGVFVTLIHHHQCDTCHRCAAPVPAWWPETWGLTPVRGNCATLSSLVSSERSQLINWAIAQLMIPRQNWQEVRWTWEQRGFLLCVAIKSLKGFKTFECYGYDYHLCK